MGGGGILCTLDTCLVSFIFYPEIVLAHRGSTGGFLLF